MKKVNVRSLVLAAVCLALCMLLPFLTGQIPEIGSALSPMHIPVLLCGFLCGWQYGLAVGLIAPLMRFVLFGMPPIFPTGVAMSVELATYGAMTGLLYSLLPKKPIHIYTALIGSMLAGRVVWGIAMSLLLMSSEAPFTFAAFLAGGFVRAVPAIICHIALIPLIVMPLRKVGYLKHA